MELYGGGMARKSNNYQLGGQIAQGRRDRARSGELRVLKRQKELADKRKARNQFVGNLTKFGLNLVAPGLGDAGKAVVESQYDKVDYTPGKFTGGVAEDLSKAEDDYKSSIKERAFSGAVESMLLGDVYRDIGQDVGRTIKKGTEFVKGIPTALEAGKEMGYSGVKALTDYVKGFMPRTELGSNLASAPMTARDLTARAKIAKQITTPDLGRSGFLDYSEMKDAYNEMYPNREVGYGDFLRMVEKGLPGQGFGRGGGLVDYLTPIMQMGGMVGTDPSMLEPPLPTPPRPMQPIERPARQAEPIAPTMGASPMMASVPPPPPSPTVGASPISATQPPPPPVQTMGASPVAVGAPAATMGAAPAAAGQTDPSSLPGVRPVAPTVTPTPSSPTGSPIGGQYGTAIGAIGALGQMGMEGIAQDPELQKYLEDLPQFQYGYRQQFGDIMAGGREAARQAYTAQRLGGAGGGFAGAGAGSQAFQQGMAGLKSNIGRQRRGVVEGYQADLLSAIRDIERKGDFEFQSPWEKRGMTEEEWRRSTRAEQDLGAEEERKLYDTKEGLGLQDWTGTTGLAGLSNMTGTTGYTRPTTTRNIGTTNQWTGMSGWAGGTSG